MSKKKPRPTPVPAEGMSGMIDAHTHLTSCTDEISALLARIVAAGVERVCTVGEGIAEDERALQAAQAHHRMCAACAIHPTKAHTLDDGARSRLKAMAADPRCVAVGETGLDDSWTQQAPEDTASMEVQDLALRWHADLAAEVNKTLMIHNREADTDLMRVLGECAQEIGRA